MFFFDAAFTGSADAVSGALAGCSDADTAGASVAGDANVTGGAIDAAVIGAFAESDPADADAGAAGALARATSAAVIGVKSFGAGARGASDSLAAAGIGAALGALATTGGAGSLAAIGALADGALATGALAIGGAASIVAGGKLATDGLAAGALSAGCIGIAVLDAAIGASGVDVTAVEAVGVVASVDDAAVVGDGGGVSGCGARLTSGGGAPGTSTGALATGGGAEDGAVSALVDGIGAVSALADGIAAGEVAGSIGSAAAAPLDGAASAGTFAVSIGVEFAEFAELGTPPVTVIESPEKSSSVLTFDPVGGGLVVCSLRIVLPIVPGVSPAENDGADTPGVIGVFTPSCALAGGASAIANAAIAINRGARIRSLDPAARAIRLSTCFGMFTVALRNKLRIHLIAELEHAGPRMPRESHPGYLHSVSDHRHQSSRLDFILIWFKGGRVGGENKIAVANRRPAAQRRKVHVIAVETHHRQRRGCRDRFAISRSHLDFCVLQRERTPIVRVARFGRGQHPLAVAGFHLRPVKIVRVQQRARHYVGDRLQYPRVAAMAHDPYGDRDQCRHRDQAESRQRFRNPPGTQMISPDSSP
ncbi:MAG: hypothetical protein Q7S58_09580 [Candidatus Binatus sp.]|nr:hypothetical protein [Candidatus Binatus sp.]